MARHNGSILILVLFVLTVLSLGALSFAYRAGLEHRAANQRVLRIQLRAQAASAAAIAIARLGEHDAGFDHRAQAWHTHRPLAQESWLEAWSGDGEAAPEFEAHYEVIDEESKLNLLYASGEALLALGMSDQQIDAIFDWMDEDDVARPQGAESDWYLASPRPYKAPNAPMTLLEELLAVRGIDGPGYFGVDRIDESQALAGAQAYGWRRLLAVVGDGRVNLNTAPRPVLEALPISDEGVNQILGFREAGAGGEEGLEQHAFRSTVEFHMLQGLSAADRQALGRFGRVSSEHFRIFVDVRHRPTDSDYRLEVLVRRAGDGVQIVQWQPRH